MGTQQIAAANHSGLQTALDVIVAPKTAFHALRDVPTWGWAFAIATVLGVIASIVISPAIAHALSVEMPARLAASPQLASMPADRRDALIAQQIAFAATFAKFAFIFIPIAIGLAGLFQALIMLVANAIGKGDGTFKKFWAVSVNASIAGVGLSSIVLMIVVLVRGMDSFSSTAEVTGSVPNLAMLVPGASKRVAAFFGVMNVFAIWAVVLMALGMEIVGRIPRGVAAAAAIVMLLLSGVFPLFAALAQR
ncbi:MAG: YIP1 family protein [Candidatus Velthaea sp.]